MEILILLALIIFGIAFIIKLQQPLSSEAIEQLAIKRRTKEIRKYYQFYPKEILPDKDFKKAMDSKGRFYEVNEDMYNFPAVAAALLKSKKHEWVIVAFEAHKRVDIIWLNKGQDRSTVQTRLPSEQILELANERGYQTVLMFHNHPNTNPNYYDCSKPSEQDINSAKELSLLLNTQGVNFLDFVCERGKYFEYWLSASSDFLPQSEFTNAIGQVNGLSRLENIKLNIERLL